MKNIRRMRRARISTLMSCVKYFLFVLLIREKERERKRANDRMTRATTHAIAEFQVLSYVTVFRRSVSEKTFLF